MPERLSDERVREVAECPAGAFEGPYAPSPDEAAALAAEVLALREALYCECGRQLSTGLCGVCDNDE